MGLFGRIQVNGALARLGKEIAANPYLWTPASDGRPHFDHWVHEQATDEALMRAAVALTAALMEIPPRYQKTEWGRQLITIIEVSMRVVGAEIALRRSDAESELSDFEEEEVDPASIKGDGEVHCAHCGASFPEAESPISAQPEYEKSHRGRPTCEYCGSYLPSNRVPIHPGMFGLELDFWKAAGSRMNEGHPASRFVPDPTVTLREIDVRRSIQLARLIMSESGLPHLARDLEVRRLVREHLGDGPLVDSVLAAELPILNRRDHTNKR